MQVVWFKRDLRLFDHEALVSAAAKGPVLLLYILEPALWKQPDLSYRHYAFLLECLHELQHALADLGHHLVLKVGEAIDVFAQIHKTYPIDTLWSHQETWNGWTYTRDKHVKSWTKSKEISWFEPSQNGVVRRLKNRDGWASRWYQTMSSPCLLPPKTLHSIKMASDVLPSADALGLKKEDGLLIQRGGRQQALSILDSFLNHRGEGYTKEMSSPVTAYTSCSRLSPYLAFGVISIREVFQKCEARKKTIQQMPYGTKGKWSSAMRSFSGRLRWHCHFIQKLEDEPRIEFENLHPAYHGIREETFNPQYFAAWKSGQTGYPMVDACMRALIKTGWINFRMRAMLMCFASYHLWLHWREPALYLAQLFTDYEPGIHYSQVQMQSGTTGMNSIRIYNPIKQGLDQDPDGRFIREWIPELREMDAASIHTPWEAPLLLNGYPHPIVDEKKARKHAADIIYGLRNNNPEHRETTRQLVDKHGSRKSLKPRKKAVKKNNDNPQQELPL